MERYRPGEPTPAVAGRDVVVVDDGIATGVTARAALQGLRAARPAKLVLAVPVGAPESMTALERIADRVVCLVQPGNFRAVGAWYHDFRQVSDDEVIRLLAARS